MANMPGLTEMLDMAVRFGADRATENAKQSKDAPRREQEKIDRQLAHLAHPSNYSPTAHR
jgi:hypothetical protein